MLTAPDFEKKQIVFIFFNDGEKMAFQNDNLIVKSKDGKIKFQGTCYRLFLIYAVGNFSITTVLLQKAKKFGFFIALMSAGFRLTDIIGAEKDGNTMLKRKQYAYDGLGIAKKITYNKIKNQQSLLKTIRHKNECTKEAIILLDAYASKTSEAGNLQELMSYEGLSSKLYFKNHFNNIRWNGRKPRLKKDIVNSVLDIGYTILFAFVESIAASYGFDLFCGVMHTQFYMRKSLICDLVEPFRPLIDRQIKNSINLGQIKEEDFAFVNLQYRLKYQKSPEYIRFLMKPLIENKDEIFLYIQSYYRAFMKELPAESFPLYLI